MPSTSLPLWRRISLAVLLLVAVRLLATQFPDHYPMEEWLFWRYLRYWAWCGVVSLGCLGTGEQIVRRLALARSNNSQLTGGESRLTIIRNAGGEVGRPILFAGMVVIIVFLPILSLQGIEGKMFRPMAFSFMSALVGALILTVTVIPVMAS